jgi:hypothetical protein
VLMNKKFASFFIHSTFKLDQLRRQTLR